MLNLGMNTVQPAIGLLLLLLVTVVNQLIKHKLEKANNSDFSISSVLVN